MLPSRRVVRKRLVLDQIPILWRMKCPWERKKIDSHLERNFVSYLNSIFCNSFRRVGLLLLSFSSFFREDNPHSLLLIRFEFFGVCDEKTFRGMTGYTAKVLGFWFRRNYVWRGWMLPRVDSWRTRHFEASKQWVHEGERSVDGKFHFLGGHTVPQSSW